MKLQDIMTKNVVSITPEESASLAARLLTRHNLGALPVCSYDGRLLGIVTDRAPVPDIQRRELLTSGPEAAPKAAARQMAPALGRRLPVVQAGKVVGMVSLGDLATNRRCDTEAADALTEISENIRRKR